MPTEPLPPTEPRLVSVTRRSRLASGAMPPSGRLLRSSAMAAGLLVLPGLAAACGNDDAATFQTADSTQATEASTDPSTTLADDAASTTVTVVGDTSTSTTAAAAAAAVDGAVFPSGAELAVSFTFEPTTSGQARNPYIAVWVEDADGNLVDTISVWYEQGGKGSRWLDDLRSWYAASGGGADTTMAGATRAAGSYTVTWDGTDLNGDAVAQGQYTLYVEAAREHGPYEITSTGLTIGEDAFNVALADDGELTSVSAELIL